MNKDININSYLTVALPQPVDNHWLTQLQQCITANLTASDFNISKLATMMQISIRNLYYKVKRLTGFSPAKYINEIRLQQAAQLLENQSYLTVSEVCYAVGFHKPAYFSLLFKKRFKVLPSVCLGKTEIRLPILQKQHLK